MVGLLAVVSAFADEGVVLVGHDCDYQLLNLSDGQMAVIKTVQGNRPNKNDILSGDFSTQGFTDVINKRTGNTLQIWVDSSSSSSSQELSQFSAYCGSAN
jgi:hypothetical protein